MKKSLLAIALLGTVGAVLAESSVTVYGTLDAGVAYTDSSIGKNDTTSLESGQQSYSRLGFKGSEDLGGGTKAMFVLEQAISLDNGSTLNTYPYDSPTPNSGNGVFSSQAWVGLGGDFGTVKLGRQLTPLYLAHTAIDPFQSGFAANINTIFGTNALDNGDYQRLSNAVTYSTADNLGGFNASVTYGFGEVTGNSAAQSQAGASLGYANGPVNVVYAYHQANNDTATTKGDTFKTNFVGATYDFGVVKAHAAFDQNEQGLNFKTQDYLLGVTVPFGQHAVFGEYTHKNNKLVKEADAELYAVGYTYNLSKRTNLYTAYTYVKNQPNAFVDVADSGASASAFQVGVRHQF